MNSFYALLKDELIRFAGPDTLSFLQAMATNDLSALAQPGNTRLTGFCSPQGRLLGLMQLFGAGDTLYARVAPGMAEPLIARLAPFVFRARVEITPVGDRRCVIGVAGTDVSAVLDRAGLPAPNGPGHTAGDEELHVLCVRDRVMELALPVSGQDKLTSALDAALPAGAPNDWEALAIADGIPEIYPATMDQFIPQMVSLDTIGGVSFDKGCYPGQEIVARIRSRGSVKRHMHRARTDNIMAAPPGTEILDDAGKSAGNVIRSAPAADGSTLLAVIADSALASALLLPGDVPLSMIQLHRKPQKGIR